MTKDQLLEWVQQEQEMVAKLKDNNLDSPYDVEEFLYLVEKFIKELE